VARYVDGFVIPLPKDKIEAYRKLANKASQIWKDHGAIDYWECIGDDLEIQHEGGPMSFLKMAGASQAETIVFAWAVFESRQKRDEANAKIMADPRMLAMMAPDKQLFDCTRMACGGFKELDLG
jgi:uncharacterized protein YbaA (DUF1428 family)